MIKSKDILRLIKTLDIGLGLIEKKDMESWTLAEADGIKDALGELGDKASIVYIGLLTDQEMAEIEREGKDLDA